MSVPLNQQDYERFKKLAEAIIESGEGEISIYIGHEKQPKGCYASIEMRCSSVAAAKLEEIFNCAPLPQAPEHVKAADDYTV
jgi:hypothetical protein